MTDADRVMEFAVFCIENTAIRLGVLGSVVYRVFNEKEGIDQFLFPSYETLHTQSKKYIVDEFLSYLKKGTPPQFIGQIHNGCGSLMFSSHQVTNGLINETLLQMKYARIVMLLSERLSISPQQALDIFYNTSTYSYLSQKKYHLHNMSDAYLVDEIGIELQNGQ